MSLVLILLSVALASEPDPAPDAPAASNVLSKEFLSKVPSRAHSSTAEPADAAVEPIDHLDPTTRAVLRDVPQPADIRWPRKGPKAQVSTSPAPVEPRPHDTVATTPGARRMSGALRTVAGAAPTAARGVRLSGGSPAVFVDGVPMNPW